MYIYTQNIQKELLKKDLTFLWRDPDVSVQSPVWHGLQTAHAEHVVGGECAGEGWRGSVGGVQASPHVAGALAAGKGHNAGDRSVGLRVCRRKEERSKQGQTNNKAK